MTVFDTHYNEYDQWYEKNRYAYLSELEAVKKVLPEKGKGLEIGVGTGRFAGPLGIQYGIDPSLNMLGAAKKRGITVMQGIGEDNPFSDSSFDYVAILIALCFVSDALNVLREAHRVLSGKGCIIIGIIDKNSFLGEFYKEKKSIFYKKAQLYSVNEMKKLLGLAGFSGFTCYQTLSGYPEEMVSIEKPKKGFGAGSFVAIRALKSGKIK